MTTFEYLAVLVSIIVGLGITHLLGGVARLVHQQGKSKLYWVHLVWMGYMFAYLLSFWWVHLWLNAVEEWNSLLYTFLVLYATLLYLLCVVITPPDQGKGIDFRQFFFSKRRWFFGILLVSGIVDEADYLIRGEIYTGWLIGGPLLIIALLTENPRFHGALALWFFFGSWYGLLTGW